MNIRKSVGSYKFIILVVIIIIILFALIYYKILDNKNNSDSFIDYSEYSKKYILEDCVNGYGKEYKANNSNDTRTVEDICKSNAYLSDPKLLCGICGTENSPLFSMESKMIRGKRYYGCKKDTDNAISLNWGDQGTAINKYLSDRLTCDALNNSSRSGIYIYIASDGECNILVNDKIVQTHNSINLAEYYIDNLGYGDKLSIQCKQVNESSAQTSKPQCGLCISYIWNKQIYILENNGYQNCANTIYYTSEGSVKWDNIWEKKSAGLLPWMKNWIRGRDGLNATLSIETFIGSTKNSGLMNNDCVIFGSATYDGDNSFVSEDYPRSWSLLFNHGYNTNSKILYVNTNYKKKFENKYYEFKIKDVTEGDVFLLGGIYNDSINNDINKTKMLDFTVSYIWCGKIFSIPQDDNFNKITEKISLISIDGSDIKYNLINRDMKNNNFLYYEKTKLNPSNINNQIMYFTVNNIKISDSKRTDSINKFQSEIAKIKF